MITTYSPEELPAAAAVGPFAVRISGEEAYAEKTFRATEFAIQVSSDGGERTHVVYRRFRHFRALDICVRASLPNLPQVPPRGILRRTVKPDFLNERKRKLGSYLSALLQADPLISSPDVRQFLGIAQDIEESTLLLTSGGQFPTLADLLGPHVESVEIWDERVSVMSCGATWRASEIGISGGILEEQVEEVSTCWS